MTAENVSSLIEGHDLVVIEFMKPGCPPCVGFEPIYEKAARDHPNAAFCRVDVTEEKALAREFGIESVPTLVLFRDRVMLASQPGLVKADALEDLLERALALDMGEVRREIERVQAEGGSG